MYAQYIYFFLQLLYRLAVAPAPVEVSSFGTGKAHMCTVQCTYVIYALISSKEDWFDDIA